MRIACHLFSFYFLLLTGMVCDDSADRADPKVATESVTVGCDRGAHDHEEPGHHDDCSPLCVCHCCHTHCIPDPVFQLEIIAPIYSLHAINHTARLPRAYHAAILQPPRS